MLSNIHQDDREEASNESRYQNNKSGIYKMNELVSPHVSFHPDAVCTQCTEINIMPIRK